MEARGSPLLPLNLLCRVPWMESLAKGNGCTTAICFDHDCATGCVLLTSPYQLTKRHGQSEGCHHLHWTAAVFSVRGRGTAWRLHGLLLRLRRTLSVALHEVVRAPCFRTCGRTFLPDRRRRRLLEDCVFDGLVRFSS